MKNNLLKIAHLSIMLIFLVCGSASAQIDDDDWNIFNQFDWLKYTNADWEKIIRSKYEGSENSVTQAFDWAKKSGIQTPDLLSTLDKIKQLQSMPQNPVTQHALEKEMQKLNDELNKWINTLPIGEDFIKGIGYELLVAQAALIAEQYEEVIYQVLEKVLPKQSGAPWIDPVRNEQIKDQNTKPNHKSLVRQIIEMFLNQMIKKEVNGSYTLQRTNIELLKQVGLVKYLQMVAMDWELLKTEELKSLQSIVSYSSELNSWYKHATTTVADGKKLYQEIKSFPSAIELPTYLQQKELGKKSTTNHLALAEMVDTRKKALATTYNQLANRYLEKAKDLESKLKTDQHFKMTEGERVKAQQIVNEYFQEALVLKMKADQLVQESYNSKTAKQKEAAMRTYELVQKFNIK